MKKVALITILTFVSFFQLFAQNEDFFEPKATVSGYGELHYNQESKDKGPTTKSIDFHRFVWFLGYAWSENWSFKSEVELEHNFVQGGQGELELEQAFINYHHADWFGFQVGVVLPSVGLINEYHEPPLFFGVERPEYNNRIIPTTWFGNGIVLYGRHSSFDYRLTVMEGLNNEKFSESGGIRSGRRKGFKADAKNPLYNFRLDYLGIEGLKVGASFTYNKASGDTSSNKVNIYELHAAYSYKDLRTIFEYGNIDYDKGNLQKSSGYYFDLGYNISNLLNINAEIIPFVRYSDTDTASETILGGDTETKNHYTYFMFGLSVKPLPQIVFKADYGVREREFNNEKATLFNVGAGYMF